MEKKSDNILHEKIASLLGKSLKNNVFTACSVGYFEKDKESVRGDIVHCGLAGEGQRTSAVDDETFFDLASLTKPLVTSLCVLALLQEGKLRLEDTMAKFFGPAGLAYQNRTLFHLLTHSSGLPAHRPYFEKILRYPQGERLDRTVDWIFAEKPLFEPGTGNLYSDLGFILLGKIIEEVSGISLDEYWRRRIIMPIGLEKELFFPGEKELPDKVYAPTGECGWTKTWLCGRVHDDNCRALGGVAGHAGVFGTAAAVLTLCETLFLQYRSEQTHPSYSSENLRQVLSAKMGGWRFGFDTPAALSSSGRFFSGMSIGHLGFTGTSFWIDLQRGIGIVFLTNRVFCGDDPAPIKKLRPLLHDLIMGELIKKSG